MFSNGSDKIKVYFYELPHDETKNKINKKTEALKSRQ